MQKSTFYSFNLCHIGAHSDRNEGYGSLCVRLFPVLIPCIVFLLLINEYVEKIENYFGLTSSEIETTPESY